MSSFIKVKFLAHAEVKPAYISLISEKNHNIISGEEFMVLKEEDKKDYKVYRITNLASHLVSSEQFELE